MCLVFTVRCPGFSGSGRTRGICMFRGGWVCLRSAHLSGVEGVGAGRWDLLPSGS